MPLTADQQKIFEVLSTSLAKSHGPGTIKILGGDEVSDIPRTPTGIPSVDYAIGGGLPDGRFIEVYGPESSGKTTLALHCIAEAQKRGKVAAFIDAEHALDINYARALDVDTDSMIINQPNSAEEALSVVEELCISKLPSLIVVDSVAALVPKAELEGDMGANLPGLHARLMSQACRKLTGICAKNGVTIIWLNQIRMKIGVMFGSPETVTGGNALKFYSSIRLDVRRTGQVKDDDVAVANETTVKVVKNKTAPPYRVANFQIKFGEGVDRVLDTLRVAVEKNAVQKSGAWFSFGGEKIGQGEANTVTFLRDNEKVFKAVQAELAKRMTQPVSKEPVIDVE